jgi:pimeloyl-ACP methyl ester carboxylesterase
MRKLLLVAAVAAALGLAAAGEARAALRFQPCTDAPSVGCATLAVPLDRSGRTPGQVTLFIRRVEARPSRGTVFLLAGGPGQPAADVFGLDSDEEYESLHGLLPGYTLVAYDMRGTGRSGVLRCSRLERAVLGLDLGAAAPAARECAERLGPARAHYSTRAAADDMDAVRTALELERVALYGTSYGAKLALAYAVTYPAGVERLLLDSVAPTAFPDAFSRSTIGAIPSVLRSVCAGSLCRGTTPDAAADFVTVANRLAARPRGRLTAAGLLNVLYLVDVDPFVRSALPAAVRAAARGDWIALDRLYSVLARPGAGVIDPAAFSVGLFAATVCEDGAFPWARTAPAPEHRAAWGAAAAAVPASAFAPLGAWAATTNPFVRFCLQWPQATEAPSLGAGPFPDVPVLAVAGDVDLRTPVADTAAAVALFPRGRLLLVPGAGHSALSYSACARSQVARWLADAATPDRCARVPPLVRPEPLAPRSLAAVRPLGGLAGKRGRTLGATAASLTDALEIVRQSWGRAGAGPIRGLRGGRLVPLPDGVRLERYSYVPGLWLTGSLAYTAIGGLGPARLDGRVTVGGWAASHGKLMAGFRLTGTLGGRSVRVRRP